MGVVEVDVLGAPWVAWCASGRVGARREASKYCDGEGRVIGCREGG